MDWLNALPLSAPRMETEMDLHQLEDARNVAVGCHTRPHKSGPAVGGILHMLTQ